MVSDFLDVYKRQNPAIALLSSGLGTLSHMRVTKFKVPAYMGSSFAYIGAMTLLMKNGGMPAIAQGAMTGGSVSYTHLFMEKYGITAPPKVMWGVDDSVREMIKE